MPRATELLDHVAQPLRGRRLSNKIKGVGNDEIPCLQHSDWNYYRRNSIVWLLWLGPRANPGTALQNRIPRDRHPLPLRDRHRGRFIGEIRGYGPGGYRYARDP